MRQIYLCSSKNIINCAELFFCISWKIFTIHSKLISIIILIRFSNSFCRLHSSSEWRTTKCIGDRLERFSKRSFALCFNTIPSSLQHFITFWIVHVNWFRLNCLLMRYRSFRKLLDIMELRCSSDYSKFVSQGVIEGYLKVFLDKVKQRSDANDLDFTDYEVKRHFDIWKKNESMLDFVEENGFQRNISFIYWTLSRTCPIGRALVYSIQGKFTKYSKYCRVSWIRSRCQFHFHRVWFR